jgi:hypothetical protein
MVKIVPNSKMTVFWVVALCCLVEFTDVTEVFVASIIRAVICVNVCKLLPDYTTQQRNTPPSETEISPAELRFIIPPLVFKISSNVRSQLQRKEN